jgi:ATP-dependent DNA helicase RecQ
MLGYLATGGCRMEYLRRELDDPAAAPCGRCDNCTGRPWSAAVSAAGTAAARDRLMRPGVDVAPRKMWPTGMKDLGVEVAGKIPAGQAAETGRALGRLTDLGWGPRLRALLDAGPAGGTEPDGPGPDGRTAPDDLVAAMVKVLAAWDWAERPAGVVTVPSRRRPQLIGSLGRQLAGIGRLPYLGALAYTWDTGGDAGDGDGPGAPPTAPGPARHFNSAQRLLGVWQALALPADLAAAVAGAGGPVLLVDDQIDTGWTMTVAARLLRLAGAPAVLPFALAVTAG